MLLVTSNILIARFLLRLDGVAVTTVAFLTLCICEQFHSFDFKSETESIFNKKIFKNKTLNISFIVSLLLTIIIVVLPIPFIQNAFGVTGINIFAWLICFGMAILIVPFTEAYKLLLRHKENKAKKLKISKQQAEQKTATN